MSERHRVANDPGKPMVFSFAGRSPHVFAYRVWVKRPGDEEWTDPGCTGDTQDDVPDSCDLGALPDGTLMDIPIAIGGKKESRYEGAVIFTQDGAVCHGGVRPFSGTTSDDGGGAEYLRVVLV